MVSQEKMAELVGCDLEYLQSEMQSGEFDWESVVTLQTAPRPKPTEAQPKQEPLPGELVHVWQVRRTDDMKDDNWNTIPKHMWHSIDREVNFFKYSQQLGETKRRLRGKD